MLLDYGCFTQVFWMVEVTFAKQSDLVPLIVLMDGVVQVCLLTYSVTVDHASCICHKGVRYLHDPNPSLTEPDRIVGNGLRNFL